METAIAFKMFLALYSLAAIAIGSIIISFYIKHKKYKKGEEVRHPFFYYLAMVSPIAAMSLFLLLV